MFAFSLIKLDEGNCIRQLFRQRAMHFNVNIQKGLGNNLHSPIYEILKQALILEYVRFLWNNLSTNNLTQKWVEKACLENWMEIGGFIVE